MKQNNRIRNAFAIALLGSTLMLTGCGSMIDQHGYVAQIGAVEDISNGMPKSEVVSILGSPTVTTTENGLSYYYIGTKQDRYNFFGGKDRVRQVVAVHFTGNKRVKKIAHYGLQDGVVVDFIAKTTPTYKKDLNFIQELFGGIGALKPKDGNGDGFARSGASI